MLLLLAIFFIHISEGKQILKLDRMDCTNQPENSPVKFIYTKTNFIARSGSTISIKVNLTRDIPGNKLHMDLYVTRCASREALDNCEDFKKITPNNICFFANLKGAAWTSFLESYSPPIRCPFKKGIYLLNDGTIDPNLFDLFPLTDYYWKIKVHVFNAKEFLFETSVEFRVLKV